MNYPTLPAVGRTDTSRAAAPSGPQAVNLQKDVLRVLRKGPATADETANSLGKSILAIRPRFSELRAQGRIVDTGGRRRNDSSNHRAIVWKLAEPASGHVAV